LANECLPSAFGNLDAKAAQAIFPNEIIRIRDLSFIDYLFCDFDGHGSPGMRAYFFKKVSTGAETSRNLNQPIN
jgi:hypothetical protein